MKKPRLGQMLTVSKELKRENIYMKAERRYHEYVNRKWVEKKITPVECMIIGVRTMSNGFGSNNEDGMYYKPLEIVKSLIVVKSLNSKPFIAPYSEFINSL